MLTTGFIPEMAKVGNAWQSLFIIVRALGTAGGLMERPASAQTPRITSFTITKDTQTCVYFQKKLS
jgi:hypothetical protein